MQKIRNEARKSAESAKASATKEAAKTASVEDTEEKQELSNDDIEKEQDALVNRLRELKALKSKVKGKGSDTSQKKEGGKDNQKSGGQAGGRKNGGKKAHKQPTAQSTVPDTFDLEDDGRSDTDPTAPEAAHTPDNSGNVIFPEISRRGLTPEQVSCLSLCNEYAANLNASVIPLFVFMKAITKTRIFIFPRDSSMRPVSTLIQNRYK